MARVNSQQWLDKWSRRLNASGPDIQSGVQRVTTAPGQLAAQAQDRMLAGVTDAITSGRWQRRVSAVPLQDWQSAMITKGIPRISQGTAQAQKTKGAAIDRLLSNVDAAAAAANALPKGGLEQSIARASTFMREMSNRSKQG